MRARLQAALADAEYLHRHQPQCCPTCDDVQRVLDTMITLTGATCPLCGLPIEDGQETKSFRPFISNAASPLFVFSDSVCHAACVRDHPLGDEAVAIEAASGDSYRPENRVCWVCSAVISDASDYFGLGFLTNTESLAVSRFNFLQAHLSHLGQWDRTSSLIAALHELASSPEWGGDALDDPLSVLASVVG